MIRTLATSQEVSGSNPSTGIDVRNVGDCPLDTAHGLTNSYLKENSRYFIVICFKSLFFSILPIHDST